MNQVDPITLEVVRGYLVSTVLQMRATLIRTAYAPILYEMHDFSCGLMTAGGELLAMSEDFSGHVFAMALGLNEARKKFNDQMFPGDVLVTNDPYTGGTHLNDIAFYTPFFVDGRLLLYIGVRAHWADVGGANPGSFSGQDTEIYQEGVRLEPVKVVERGKVNQALWDVMFANMRIPEEQEGNALAMIDTAKVAEAGITELCEKYGGDTIQDCMDVMLDHAEATVRERISHLPDGEYYYEHYSDNSGLSADPLPIKVKLTIEGETMTFDFTGSSPQVNGPMNCGIPVTQGGAFVIVKCWLDPKTPVNGGTFRPMRFVIPEGSNLSAELPAAVGGCWDIYRQVETAVVGLFAQFMPDELGGETPGGDNHNYISGYDHTRSRRYLVYEAPHAGMPATSETDGATGCILYDCGGIPTINPAEAMEQREPVLIETLVARIDGESPGYRRSGFGITRRVRVLEDNSQLSVMTDRAVIPPWGAAGAYPGGLNSFTVLRDGEEIEPSHIPGKVKAFPLYAGDVVVTGASSGGGVGDPLEREVEMVLKDVFLEYVTPERARDVYGVAIENGEVNPDETRKLRDALRGQRCYLKVSDWDDEFDERGLRLARLSRGTADRIGVRDGDMLEYVSATTAPLRAWARVVDEAADGTVPLGPRARNILRIGIGDEIWLRRLQIKAPTLA